MILLKNTPDGPVRVLRFPNAAEVAAWRIALAVRAVGVSL